jgi:hypothetical protein
MNNINSFSDAFLDQYFNSIKTKEKKKIYQLIYCACLSTACLFQKDNEIAKQIAKKQTLLRMIEIDHFG